MNVVTPGESIKRLMPTATFVTDPQLVKEMAQRVVGSGMGASFLRKGDTVISLKGVVRVSSPRSGQQEPIEYLAIVVDVQEEGGAIKEKLAAFSTLIRRRPGADKYHGIFAEPQFEKLENYEQMYDAMLANPRFKVSNVERNVEFPTFKATVMDTVRG